jgi:hypothetical protein
VFVTDGEAVNVGAVLVEDFGIKPWSSIRTLIDTSDVYSYVCVSVWQKQVLWNAVDAFCVDDGVTCMYVCMKSELVATSCLLV